MSDWWSSDPVAGDTSSPGKMRLTVYPQGGEPKYADAISSIESGGNYRAVGPTTRTGDRAYGKYQVMGQNIPEWTKEALGREMTRQEFLLSPEAQDAVFNHRFGGYVEKYGPEDAAKAWFAGEKGMSDPNRRDVLGTSVDQYGKKFSAALGSPGGTTDVSAQSRLASDPRAIAPTTVGMAPGSAPTPSGGNWWNSDPVSTAVGMTPETAPREAAGPPQPPKEDIGQNKALGIGVVKGATANFGDELRGVQNAAGLPNWVPGAVDTAVGAAKLGYEYLAGGDEAGQKYREGRDQFRELTKTAQEQYPGTVIGGEVGGAIASTPGRLLQAATLPARAARSAAVGAGYGALAGAGEGEDTASRVSGAVQGGVIGGALGGLGSPVIDVAARGAGTLAREAGRYLAPNVDARAAGAIQGAQRAAAQTDPTAVGRLTGAEMAGNPAATLGDTAGEQGRALARWASNASPEARDVLNQMANDRYEGQAGRIVGWLNNTFHYPNARAQQEALEQTGRQVNNVAYGRAMQEGSGGLWSPELERLAGSDAVSRAMQRASVAGKDEAIVGGGGAFNPRVTFTPDGRMQMARGPTGAPTYPDLQYWDLVRRELSDAAQEAMRAGRVTEGRRLTAFANNMNAELDRLVPSYQTARSTAANFFGARDALEAGQNFVRQNLRNDEVRAQLARMSPTERQLFQDGFVSRYIDTLNATGNARNVLNQVANSPQAVEKLQMVLGPARANELEAMLRVEGVMQMMRAAQQGNSTTARQLIELGVFGGGGLANLYSQGMSPESWAQSALLGAFAARSRRTDQRVAQRVAEMLTSRDPQILTRGLQTVARNQGLMDGIRALDQRLARIGGQEATAVPAIQMPGVGRADEAQQAGVPESMEGIVNVTSKMAPNGLPWEGMRQSTNIDDIRQETGGAVKRALSGDKAAFDEFVSRYGALPTYNLIVDKMNKGEPVPKSVLGFIDAATQSVRSAQQQRRQ